MHILFAKRLSKQDGCNLMKLRFLWKRIDVHWLIKTCCFVLNFIFPYLSKYHQMNVPFLPLFLCRPGGVVFFFLVVNVFFCLGATWVAQMMTTWISVVQSVVVGNPPKGRKEQPPLGFAGTNWNGNCRRWTASTRCHRSGPHWWDYVKMVDPQILNCQEIGVWEKLQFL